jgi:hypothetical protein
MMTMTFMINNIFLSYTLYNMEYSELFTTKNIIIFIIVVILIVAIFYYWRSRTTGLEKFSNSTDGSRTPPGKAGVYPTAASGAAPFKTQQTTGVDTPDVGSALPNRTPTNPSDLLPSNTGANWGNLYPVQTDNGGVYVPSLVDASFAIGINSIGNVNKNSVLELRSQPIITKQAVSPWNNSSYTEDLSRIGLDIAPTTR